MQRLGRCRIDKFFGGFERNSPWRRDLLKQEGQRTAGRKAITRNARFAIRSWLDRSYKSPEF
jgi:hypothetical protein